MRRKGPSASGNVSSERPDVLTIREVARFLRIKDRTVYALANKGEIPAFKVGRQWRFHRSRILEFYGLAED